MISSEHLLEESQIWIAAEFRRHRSGKMEMVRDWIPPESSCWGSVVLVHGLGEHSGRYQHVGMFLARRGLRVRAFDLFGFGSSGGARAYTEQWEIYLEQTEDHLKAVSSPQILWGHSMGGLIVMDYLISDRTSPDLAVLSAPALQVGKAWQRLLTPLLARVAPRLKVSTRISGDQLSRDPEVGQAYMSDKLVLKYVTPQLGWFLMKAMERVNHNLDRIEVPTYVFAGGADSLVPCTSSTILADLSTVDRKVYPKLRHECHNEPEAEHVLTDTYDWIQQQLSPSYANSVAKPNTN